MTNFIRKVRWGHPTLIGPQFFSNMAGVVLIASFVGLPGLTIPGTQTTGDPGSGRTAAASDFSGKDSPGTQSGPMTMAPTPTPTISEPGIQPSEAIGFPKLEPPRTLSSSVAPASPLPPPGQQNVISIADSEDHESTSVTAFDPTTRKYLVIWVNETSPARIDGRFITEEGALDGEVIPISIGQVDQPTRLVLTANPTQGGYLLTWIEMNGMVDYTNYCTNGSCYAYSLDRANLYTLAISEDGAPSAEGPTLITDQLTVFDSLRCPYDIAYNTQIDEYLAVWEQPPGGKPGYLAYPHHLTGQRLDAEGRTKAPQVTIEPLIGTDIKVEYSSVSNQYIVIYDDYSPTDFEYDLKADLINPISLQRIGGAIQLTSSYGWQILPLLDYDPTGDYFYFVYYSNDPFPSGQAHLYGVRINAATLAMVPPYEDILSDVTQGEAALAYSPVVDRHLVSDRVGEDLLVRSIDGEGVAQDDVMDLYSEALTGGIAARTVTLGITPEWLVTWESFGDILGTTVGQAISGVMVPIEPTGFEMVLSLRPNFRWEGLPEAYRYILRLSRANDDLSPGPSLPPVVLGAEETRDPNLPTQQTFKLDYDLTSGSSLPTGGYYWYVEAWDTAGNFLGESYAGAFQIPALGSWDAMRAAFPLSNLDEENPFWHAYDDLIYRWSEIRDLPPALVKAIIAHESGKLTWNQRRPPTGEPYSASATEPVRFEPRFAYMYEPLWDWISYDWAYGLECPDHINCARWQRQGSSSSLPRRTLPENPLFVCGVGMRIEECAAATLAATGFRYPYDDARAGFLEPAPAGYHPFRIGDFVYPFGRGYSYTVSLNDFFHINSDLNKNRDYNPLSGETPQDEIAYAQIRVSASYGLGQILALAKPHYLNALSGGDPYPPEKLYEPEFNLEMVTRFLAESRCDQVEKYDGAYVSAAERNLSAWRFPILVYNNRPGQFDIIRQYYDLTQPVNIVPGLVESPAIMTVDNPGLVPDQHLEGIEKTSCRPDETATGSLAPDVALASYSRQISAGEAEIARALADLQADGTENLIVQLVNLSTESTPAVQGILRIYDDPDGNNLLWEMTTEALVHENGFFDVLPGPLNGDPVLQVSWLAGAHGMRTYLICWNGSTFERLPFENRDGLFNDGGVSSEAGGAFLQPDGTFVAYYRGEEALDETLGDVYVLEGDSYAYTRSFIHSETAVDEQPPQTSLTFVAPPNSAGWLQSPGNLRFIASDDSDVRWLYIETQNFSTSDKTDSSLAQYDLQLQEGRWQIKYYAEDIYNNLEDIQTAQALVDGTPPVTNASLQGIQTPSGELLNQATVELASQDPTLADGSSGSGAALLEYSLDGEAPWIPYTGALVFDKPGGTTLLYRSRDIAGNLEAEHSLTFRIVENQPPIVAAGEDISLEEGAELVQSGSFSDPDSQSWSGSVIYGDGAGAQDLTLGGDNTFELDHRYADNGEYIVMVTITDGTGAQGSDSFTVHVSNVAPLVDAGPDQVAEAGELVQFAGSFEDPGTLDTHTFEWDFGDGQTASGTLTLEHTYAAAGVYVVTLTVTDDDGGQGSDSLQVEVQEGFGPNAIVLDSDRAAQCMILDPDSGDYRWVLPDGAYIEDVAQVTHLRQVLLIRNGSGTDHQINGVITLRAEVGIARLRLHDPAYKGWQVIVDTDISDKASCP